MVCWEGLGGRTPSGRNGLGEKSGGGGGGRGCAEGAQTPSRWKGLTGSMLNAQCTAATSISAVTQVEKKISKNPMP